jgi:GT2 family glycosyltransferase
VRLIALPENRGFAAAVNAGVGFGAASGAGAAPGTSAAAGTSAARGAAAGAAEFVLVLNGDTALVEDPLPALLKTMDEQPRRAVAGPRLVYPDDRAQESRERFPSVGSTLAGFFGGSPGAAPPWTDADRTVGPAVLRRPSWYLMGAALLFRRKALDAVGPLDENYFFYLEEVDWFRRAARAGWGWALASETRVIHHLGASLRAADPGLEARIKRNWYRSRLRYFLRHEGAGRTWLLRAGSLPPLAANALRHRARALVSSDPAARERARVAAAIFADYLFARVGPC